MAEDFSPGWGLLTPPPDASFMDELHAHFYTQRAARDLRCLVQRSWRTSATFDDIDALEVVGEITRRYRVYGSAGSYFLCVRATAGEVHLSLNLRPGDDTVQVLANVGAATPDECTQLLDATMHALPECRGDDDVERLRISFWSSGRFGADERVRRIDGVRWDDIAVNYPDEVRGALSGLVESTVDSVPARLHLWSGDPGTGKTHAVRALGEAWRPWCDTHYITDPEQFFGSSDYMMSVVLGDGDVSSKWRLVVLEDAGEFLAPDAPVLVGQGFSRLLNLTDGILGHGARTMLLVTTNTDLRTLHPAATRPGRAASYLTFTRFTPGGGTEWLAAQGKDMTLAGYHTLAELYALRDDTPPVIAGGTPKSVGFTARQ